MNSSEIFTTALNLAEPWFVETVSLAPSGLDNKSKELHITINFVRGHKFVDRSGASGTAYDTTDYTWQHLNFFEYKCFIHARVPRVEWSDGQIIQVQVPWARKGSGFTLMFEAFSMLLIECEMPVNKVAKCTRVTVPRIWRVFNYWIKLAVSKDDLSSVCEVGIDETSSKKGHEYVTVFVDMEKHRVIDVEIGKDKQTIEKFVVELENKGGDRKQIEQVSIDMSPSFISGVLDMLSNAQITFDKFHIIQHLNIAMDEVRKGERKDNELIKNQKYTFLKDSKKLSLRKQEDLSHILMLYPILGEAYRLKTMFMDVFDIENSEQAKGYLQFWCDMAKDSKIQPFIKFATMIKTHWFGIINYFDSKLTNGILEGINSKIQLLKRRARGYRKIENYINMIFFCCGKLKFDYPQYTL